MLSSLDLLYLAAAGAISLLGIIGFFVGIQLMGTLKKISRLVESAEDTVGTMNMYVKLPAGIVIKSIDWINSKFGEE